MDREDIARDVTVGFTLGVVAYSATEFIKKYNHRRKVRKSLKPYRDAFNFVVKKIQNGEYANDSNLEQMRFDYEYAKMIAHIKK